MNDEKNTWSNWKKVTTTSTYNKKLIRHSLPPLKQHNNFSLRNFVSYFKYASYAILNMYRFPSGGLARINVLQNCTAWYFQYILATWQRHNGQTYIAFQLNGLVRLLAVSSLVFSSYRIACRPKGSSNFPTDLSCPVDEQISSMSSSRKIRILFFFLQVLYVASTSRSLMTRCLYGIFIMRDTYLYFYILYRFMSVKYLSILFRWRSKSYFALNSELSVFDRIYYLCTYASNRFSHFWPFVIVKNIIYHITEFVLRAFFAFIRQNKVGKKKHSI